MTPIGLDLSLTSTGFVGGEVQRAICSKLRGMPRLEEIRSTILAAVREFPDPFVLVEGYSFGSRNSQAHAAGELGGVVRHTLYMEKIPYVDVPPSNLKMFATGKGNASKSEIASAVSARTGIVFSGKGADDILDAWVLREMGLTRLGLSAYSWPKVNLRAFDKLDWTTVNL